MPPQEAAHKQNRYTTPLGDTEMAWETRNGRGRYYTRSERIDGRTKRTYVGTGAIGDIGARTDMIGRAALTKQAIQLDQRRQELQIGDDLIAELYRDCRLLMQTALVATGYHRHDRGEWRRRRG
jgi:hypothetical protein